MSGRDREPNSVDRCTHDDGHDWQVVHADRVLDEYWPPYAEITYRCRYCNAMYRFRRTLRR